MNFSQQQVLINNLIPLVNHAEFDKVFSKATSQFSASERFMLKMELKRLCAPCLRVIDLRGKVDGDCFEFNYKGQIHYLDNIALKRFKQLLDVYSHIYSMGIYEALQATENNFKVMQRNNITPEQAAKRRGIEIQVPVLDMNQYIGRKEERVLLSSPITLISESGVEMPAMSSNLSLTGLRVRLDPKYQIEKGEQLRVRFNGLEQEYANSVLIKGCDYHVLASEIHNKKRVLGLVANNPSDSFVNFLKSFLKSYRGRSRIDVDNMINAVQIKGYEQFYISQATGLPLYFDGKGILKHQLRNRVNTHIISYWKDEQTSRLGQLLNSNRIQDLRRRKQGRVLFYSFTHVHKEVTSYYAASSTELDDDPELQQLFWGFGSRKPSWRVFQFQWHHCSVADMAFRSALPQVEIEQQHNMALAGLKDISLFGMLTDISNPTSLDIYQRHFNVERSPNLLSRFNLDKHASIHVNDVVHEYTQMRKEGRYLHQTGVVLHLDGKDYPCETMDISSAGLQVCSQQPIVNITTDSQVFISLSSFSNRVSSFNLDKLNYTVVNCNQSQTVFNLRVPPDNESLHDGKRFFTKLIRDNKDKLDLVPEIVARESLSRALRGLVSHYCFNRALFLSKHNVHFSACMLTRGIAASSLDQLFNVDELDKHAHLNNLLGRDDLFIHLVTQLRELKLLQSIDPQILYISCNDQGEILQTRQEQALSNAHKTIEFIKTALKHGSVRVVEIRAVRTGRPNRAYFDKELSYISSYAIHRAKQLEDEIWSSFAMFEFVDLTDEVLGQIKASNRLVKARLQSKTQA
ncbi:PilZ domain-containing protein [Alginatibacterium sediminis]|uniref:PilZ domain-containing protein n=1 Tax=Alginatibacterium sediminis TaxID=2164068 RepID=A0A420E886_9ALTE|nr:PilZ domain-containing protein [Alginatibacterium sediminis]RKF15729.1 PilZ domain-containing protein [Alginatibacterium sediminis]